MKKLLILSLVTIAIVGNSFAQTQIPGSSTALQVTMSDVLISSVKIKEGTNSFPVPDGRGTIKFVKRGDKFIDVVYTDAAGKSTNLTPNRPGTDAVLPPVCKTPLPNACFGSASKVGMCVCRPGDFSNGNEVYNIGLLLPAVQKVREAAARL
jgi:hypothetical protein